ncbi:uncharacterized protein B0P05DRAFT_541189 [Gilbertella persicaria]|uniref:uncharacterized protein n=1 Tax=Gilbertella persicaria TaxID=101096 RepID=UPI00221F8659|nr:uncharacterized protein B0P05DRAFT_541189 [Gilbertella persicaria]KAI8079580.1 hypothetical protein B0P05DRAFT_541189 [Gilbertella persicaria]
MEEAINQLQDLGVTRGQAKRALARYNNDVALAADYIFSGADLSDEEQDTPQNTMESDEQLALRLSQETASTQQAPLTKDTTYDRASWSVVPFTSVDEKKADVSLTWWTDPENLSDRLAKDHIPIGLRPPLYNFAYVPIVLQALFHITAFRHAVLSFRPFPSGWGTPQYYWRGLGDPVPIDMIQTTTTTPPPVTVKEGSLIPLDSPEATPMAQLSLEDAPIVKPTYEPMSRLMRSFAELQKLFGYMQHTKRAYAHSYHLVKALNQKERSPREWEYTDVSFEGFLDMLIQCLVQVDEQSTQATQTDFVPIFRNLFLLKARIEYKQESDYDDDEVYYLSIRLDHGMDSFHACLDPLIYVDNDRFTTFKQIPPLLWVVLENRTSPHTTDLPYTIDTTIYMDRYMQEDQKRALEGFKKIESSRKQIVALEAQIQALEGNAGLSRLDILTHTMTYFKDRQEMVDILSTVQQSIQARLTSLKNKVKEIKQDMTHAFEDMKQHPYDLRATLHHDGKHGTGHYWAYVYVEPSEISLLPDIPVEDKGGWFKFCDASVVPVSDQAMLDDPTPPFSLLYASQAIPQFTRDQLSQCVPQTLFDFVQLDHTLLEQEIEEDMKHSTTSSSLYFDDTGSVGTAVPAESQVFTGESLHQLKTTVEQRMEQVTELSGHDPIFLKSFEAFLARSQNQSALEHFYLLYSSEKNSLDEEASLSDPELEIIWQEYNRYLNVGQWIVQALDYFVQKDYSRAVDALLATKQQEDLWKTQLMLNQDVYQAYHGLEALSFQPLIERYGKACVQIMNDTAYAKACQPSYRTRGLEDGIRLAQQAQAMIGSDPIAKEALSEKWLSFTERSDLTDHEAELLTKLIMTWLEGQATDNKQQPEEFTYSSLEPLWKTYQHLCTESELLLLQINTK